MERIILIETSTALCSTALAENGQITSYRESCAPKAHASLTAVFIQEMLAERNLSLSDCDAVCVSKGPGSYTGLRVGVSTAKGLCFGSEKPLLAVGTLDTLVAQASGEGIPGQAGNDDANGNGWKYIIPMIDARRMEVYTQMFDTQGQPLNEVKAEIVTEESFKEWRGERQLVIFGNGAAKCLEVLNDATYINVTPSARGLAALAHQRLEAGQTEDIAYFEPFYLKDFIIIPSKKKLL